jgi:hypothetical protein
MRSLTQSSSPRLGLQATDRVSASAAEPIKSPPMQIIGECLTNDEFVRYVESLVIPDPQPTRIFLHHTWKPTPETWRGLSTIMSMKAYYERQLWRDSQGRLREGWNAGPHLFVAQDGIWLFSDLRYDGVGVYGHNYRTRHLEMVGDYDVNKPTDPILESTIVALGALHERLGLDVHKLNFHRDFSTKSCPGWAVTKEWIIPLIDDWITEYRRTKNQEQGVLRQSLQRMIADLLLSTNPHTALVKSAEARGLLGALTNEFPMEIDDRAYIVQLFAEALLVPVPEWDKVQSLNEFERRPSPQPRPGARAAATAHSEPVSPLGPPPTDPYHFDGTIR